MQSTNPSRLRTLVVCALVLASAFAIYLFFTNLGFRVVGTNPKTSKVATVSPFLKVSFNKTLSSKAISLSSKPDIINSYSVDGKILNITLKSPMDAGRVYTVTIERVSDVNGRLIINKQLVFTPQVIPSQDLPKDQAEAILKQQSYHPPSRNNISFSGTDTLVTYGVSLTQIDDFRQAIFQFTPAAKSVVIDTASVKPVPHNPNSASTSDTINFSLKVDTKAYSARIDYSDLTVLRLYLYDGSGNQVFDSKNVSLDY